LSPTLTQLGITRLQSSRWQAEAAVLKLDAERKAGQMLTRMQKHPGGDPRGTLYQDDTGLPPTLEQLGITYMQSSRWQAEPFERKAAKQRQVKAGKERGRGTKASGKSPEAIGRSRDALGLPSAEGNIACSPLLELVRTATTDRRTPWVQTGDVKRLAETPRSSLTYHGSPVSGRTHMATPDRNGLRLCNVCYQWRPANEFRLLRRGGTQLRRQCKYCHADYQRRWKMGRKRKRLWACLRLAARRKASRRLVQCLANELVKRLGGVEAAADLWVNEILSAPLGSARRLRGLQAIHRLLAESRRIQAEDARREAYERLLATVRGALDLSGRTGTLDRG